MSVRTEADEHLDAAKLNIKNAIDHINEIVVNECWGYDDFKGEYFRELCEIHIDLLAILRKIRR
jgi:hypothetical protein